MRSILRAALFAAFVLPALPSPATGQDITPPVITADPAAVAYTPIPGFPRGADLHIISGDPETGPFETFIRLQPGVTVPMHYHNAAERSIGIQGDLVLRYEDGTREEISPGRYMRIPRRKVHEATCRADGPVCVAYFHFDRAFDTMWVADPPADPNPMR